MKSSYMLAVRASLFRSADVDIFPSEYSNVGEITGRQHLVFCVSEFLPGVLGNCHGINMHGWNQAQ